MCRESRPVQPNLRTAHRVFSRKCVPASRGKWESPSAWNRKTAGLARGTLTVLTVTTFSAALATTGTHAAAKDLVVTSGNPGTASNLPAQTSLPDPLVMLDGRKVTTRECG
jgi:hypothetical protein